MKNIQPFLEKFEYELTASDISVLSLETKEAAINCGKSNRVTKKLKPETWNLLEEMSNDLWDGDLELNLKIKLGFELFDIFPHYYHFLVPFYNLFRNNELDKYIKLKNFIWGKFMTYLGAEKYYSDTVSYVLWVEFFEDYSTVDETWKGLLNNCENNNSIRVLIENAGPVPFELKEPVYQKLITDENNQMVIFNSLLHSSFDVYGKVDNSKAQLILSQLKIDTETEHYKMLKEKINKS